MKIHVRRRHIVKGKRGDPGSCPIALAYEEARGERPRVGICLVCTSDGQFPLPLIAQRFIDHFDAGKPVKPFAFVLK